MSEQNIETVKRQVEAQLSEYEQAIADYAAFMAAWRERSTPPPPATRAEPAGYYGESL